MQIYSYKTLPITALYLVLLALIEYLKGVQVAQQLNPAYMTWQSASRAPISPTVTCGCL